MPSLTGAAKGIGRAITGQLVAEGHYVVAVEIDHVLQGEAHERIRQGQVTFIAVDIRQEEAV
ncbi:MAG: SDR family NAD(P)-dependent oxidoreductase [Flavobacteriales bacterium]|nr:MAG: SDR family NAD(P)-dependent oxidoreductase [Flavobacteriales bacterium]